MFDRLHRERATDAVIASLRAVVADFDAALLTADESAGFVDRFAVIERMASAGKTLAAGRVADGDAWQSEGDRSAGDWLAKRTGGTVTESRDVLRTASRLGLAPGTDAAFRSGELSAKQAEAIASAAVADPSSESRLLDMAKYQSLQKLRDECARVEAAADPDPKARHERIRKNRFWRRWTNRDGSRGGSYSGTPEEVAMFEARAQPFIDARIDQARQSGERESSEAYAFDGLMAMADAAHEHIDVDVEDAAADDESVAAAPTSDVRRARGGRGRKRISERRELLAILHLNPPYGTGEPTAEIAGIGPVPLAILERWFADALLRIVIRDGVDVRTVVHAGRTANLLQETAILARQQLRCGRPGCGRPIKEIDHRLDFADTHTTTLDDLLGLCGHCHDLKKQGHSHRRNVDGTITWTRPDGTEEHERPPPPP